MIAKNGTIMKSAVNISASTEKKGRLVLAMDKYTATEIAYKNGYADGKRDAGKHGRWRKRIFDIGNRTIIGYRCSECNTNWDAETNYCPHCGANMEE